MNYKDGTITRVVRGDIADIKLEKSDLMIKNQKGDESYITVGSLLFKAISTYTHPNGIVVKKDQVIEVKKVSDINFFYSDGYWFGINEEELATFFRRQ